VICAEQGTNRGTTQSSNTTASPKTLKQMGITKDQSSQFQKLADKEVARYVYVRIELDKEQFRERVNLEKSTQQPDITPDNAPERE